jgi:Restriction endonuclease S subunits
MENKLPERWEWKKLGEIAEINPKFDRQSISGNIEVTFLPMKCIEELTGNVDTSNIKNIAEVSKGYTPLMENDLIYAKITPCMENGKIAIAKGLKNNLGFASTEFHVIRFEKKAYDKFFFFYLIQKRIRKYAALNMTGSAGQKRVPASFLNNLLVPLPPIETQQKIVSILEKAEETKKLRAQADELTQKLLQSVFLEMFGDPVENPNQFDVIQLKSVFSEEKEGTKCGPFGSALKKHEYVENGIPVWTMDNIAENKFTTNGCLFITEEKYRELKAYSVDEGDILISRAGTVGKMCVVSSIDYPSIISTNLIRLSLNPSKIQAIYFTSLMTYFKGRIGRLKTGEDGAYTFMNTGILKDLRIPLPPFKLQRSFARIVEQVEKTKLSQQQSSIEINNLFDAIVQKAFTGELVL